MAAARSHWPRRLATTIIGVSEKCACNASKGEDDIISASQHRPGSESSVDSNWKNDGHKWVNEKAPTGSGKGMGDATYDKIIRASSPAEVKALLPEAAATVTSAAVVGGAVVNLSGIGFGFVGDQYGRRPVCLVGCAVSVAGAADLSKRIFPTGS